MEISGLEERLVYHFGWGLRIAVEPPELKMRVEILILIKKATMEKISLDESIAFFIAKHFRTNVRKLEGTLKIILAYARFTGYPIVPNLTKAALLTIQTVRFQLKIPKHGYCPHC